MGLRVWCWHPEALSLEGLFQAQECWRESDWLLKLDCLATCASCLYTLLDWESEISRAMILNLS